MKVLSATQPTVKTCVTLYFAIAMALYSVSASATPRDVVASHFAASSRQVAFSVQEEHGIGLVIADLRSGSVIELKSSGNRLIFPHLSLDGSRLLVVRQHSNDGTSDLLSCTTDTFRCKQLHTSKDAIASPVEIDERRILFVSSKLRTGGSNLRSKYLGFQVNSYVNHDIWRLDVGQSPIRATDFELYELADLSVTASNVYFHGMGPRSRKPVIPQFEPVNRPASDVFRLPLDKASGLINLPEAQLKPLFLQEGYTFAAAVSADESLAALIRTTTNWRSGGFRYDLVVQDLQTGANRTIAPSGHFSRPIFVGNAVLVNEVFDYKYVIKRLVPGDPEIQLVLEIWDEKIIHAPIVEIVTDAEVR